MTGANIVRRYFDVVTRVRMTGVLTRYLPSAAVSRCDPPAPGMRPIPISGRPNFADFDAKITSHFVKALVVEYSIAFSHSP